MDDQDTTRTDWLTPEQAARITQVGTKSIYRAVKARQLRAARIGGRRSLRIHRDWLTQWLERLATPIEVSR